MRLALQSPLPQPSSLELPSPLKSRYTTFMHPFISRLLVSAALLSTPLLLNAEQTGTPRRVLAGDDSTHRLAIIAAVGSLEWEIPVTAIHDAWILTAVLNEPSAFIV